MKIQTEDDVWGRVTIIDDAASCWVWQGKTKPRRYRRTVTNYPVIRYNGRQVLVRRWVAEHYPVKSRHTQQPCTLGNSTNQFYVSNKCWNSLCVRPDHLLIEDTQSWRKRGSP